MKLFYPTKSHVIILAFILPIFFMRLAHANDNFQAGAGLLEIFKTDSIDDISNREPSLVVPWMHNLVCRPPESGLNIWQVREGYPDAFLVPELAPGFGAKPGSEYSSPYVARISFYYEVRKPGRHKFSVWHGHNILKLIIGDFLIASLSANQSTTAETCEFEKGFYKTVLFLISDINTSSTRNDPYFEVQVLAPNATAAEVISRDMMFIKPADMPYPWRQRGHHGR